MSIKEIEEIRHDKYFLPACLFTGGAHGGYSLQLTGAKQEPS